MIWALAIFTKFKNFFNLEYCYVILCEKFLVMILLHLLTKFPVLKSKKCPISTRLLINWKYKKISVKSFYGRLKNSSMATLMLFWVFWRTFIDFTMVYLKEMVLNILPKALIMAVLNSGDLQASPKKLLVIGL